MNSFRFIERGIEAEIERQRAILDAGEEVEQETLHFDPRSGALTSLRSKEEAHDYRYFPEPDLVPIAPTEEMLAEARAALPELPAERRERYLGELGLTEKLATLIAFDTELGEYFEARARPAEDVAGRAARQLDHRRSRRAAARGGRGRVAGRVARSRRRRSRSSRRWRSRSSSPPAPPARCWRSSSRTGGTRPRSPSARGSTGGRGRPRGDRREGARGRSRRRRAGPRGEHEGGRAARSASSCARPRAAPTAARSRS